MYRPSPPCIYESIPLIYDLVWLLWATSILCSRTILWVYSGRISTKHYYIICPPLDIEESGLWVRYIFTHSNSITNNRCGSWRLLIYRNGYGTYSLRRVWVNILLWKSGVSLLTRTITGILALRVYAIYNQSKRVLIFLVILLVVSFAVNVAQASGALSKAGIFLD